MINEEKIYSEVGKFVADLVDSGVVSRVEWITDSFLSSRASISGEGASLYRYCTRAHVNRIVKSVVKRYDVEARAVQDDQLRLDGFDYLQRAYTMPREGHIDLVPINKCTNDELLTRAVDYDKQAKGCISHADELRLFVGARGGVTQVA